MYFVHSPMLYQVKSRDGEASSAPPGYLGIGRVVWLSHRPKRDQVEIDAFVDNIGMISADCRTLTQTPIGTADA
jgi:hypothetical protein